VQHELGPTYEFYSIANPEPGKWRIQSLGVAIAPSGEPLHISFHTDKRSHKPPISKAKATPTHGRGHVRVVFTVNGSRAVEGRIRQYVWSFGDGTRGRGARVKHTYRHSGHYTALLEVIDTSGASTLASTKTITIRR
jgi:PKD repeat protein